ncbi:MULTISPECIES: aldose epimerase family protein [unclassified Pseudoxanthomonas]|uniref:aldose epimerase family protein n=1 Tax=unclassified Pseudoxanthomonas TaxID=2645906 RepID=UPI0017D17EC8|nr:MULTISPECIES: aldose epimerase family protein [unclassified Pseudoxanthomonas]MBB3275875.1 aldose 1-epimerase [Pseudoxanthomonas sp. OG2]
MAVGCMGALALAVAASAGAQQRTVIGTLPDGTKVESILLRDGSGMQARVLTLGAALHSLEVPDRDGKYADVVLGDATLQATLAKPQYFGTVVGRFANRIARGRFTLDGREYSVPTNDGPNSLHGGARGFDKVVWDVVEAKPDRATLRHVSADGDQGYPGTLTVTATYALEGDGRLAIEYRASTDAPTIVNLSNHAYWNLSGEGSGTAMDHELMIAADAYTPVDATLIPTGEFRPVAGTVFDFRTPKPIGRDLRTGSEPQLLHGRGYDHNWVISREPAKEAREVARVHDPRSGRVMSLVSAQPGLQFYSGNFLDGTTVGKSGRVYRQGDAIALEPQLFPDTPNQPAFGSARLVPGQQYVNRMVYRFSTDKDASSTR